MKKDLSFSFEFFPPKTAALEASLWQAIMKLEPLNPDFVSVTYGAGGTTRERTHNTIQKILEKTNLSPASHLTCIGAGKEEIEEIAQKYLKLGVKHIVALRGDLPEGHDHKNDEYQYASDLIYALRKQGDFEISVAGYPEKHPEAKSLSEDIDNLKRKIDAGASRVITQYFFDNNVFYEYLNLVEKKQIKASIVPGIMPIVNFKQTVNFSKGCDTKIPEEFYELFDESFVDQSSRHLLAGHVAIRQCLDLMKNGISNFHFYTLNRADLTYAICHILKNS
jgi:methylenetetrahydrofolate reductase (NADPH)